MTAKPIVPITDLLIQEIAALAIKADEQGRIQASLALSLIVQCSQFGAPVITRLVNTAVLLVDTVKTATGRPIGV